MNLAGRYGDGVITGASAALRPELRAAFAAGASLAGRDPAALPVLAELFVVVGNGAPPPAAATAIADTWVVSTDPEEHAAAIRTLLEAGVSEVYINAAQSDQRLALDFYGREVLPRVRGELAAVR
jgi:alkanesulfonate monooxygenase SsuD/methylene tetrahydromethanopterin reductase-like flavin-dependent oxidoreductase (luciferase family)